jgi:transcriptional regulator with GAF, ATPase, and Fis domain
MPSPALTLDTFNLEHAERRLCVEALNTAGNLVGAARLLGITRHALKRRIVKLSISWPTRRVATVIGDRAAAP